MRGCAVVDHSKVELLACPFCGENEIVQTEVWSGFHGKWVNTQECKCCGAAAPVEVWSQRYSSSPQTEQQPVGRVLTYEESLRSDGKSGPAFWFGPLPAGAFLYAAPIAQTAALRYTNDGSLAECPCCGSLDVGGAHDTVHCYRCGLTVTKPRPLKNAIDAWNMRTGKQTAPQPQYGRYETRPAESVAGIAKRQLGDERRWVEIRDLNAHAFPDIGPHDYYQVGTLLTMPAAPQPEQSGLVEALADAAQSLETISNGAGKDEFMQDMADVRGYARSRAGVARAALSAQGGEA